MYRQEDFTALYYAVHYGHVKVAKLLVDRGADMEINSEGVILITCPPHSS